MTLAEYIPGAFALEKVVVVEFTDKVFALSIFDLYTSKKTWFESESEPSSKAHFIAIKDIKDNSIHASQQGTEDEDAIFWEKIKTKIRQVAVLRTQILDQTFRLVLQGPSTLDPKVLSTLQSALGTVTPSPSRPLAVRMRLTDEEIRRNTECRRRQHRIFTCVLRDPEGELLVKDYENDLLKAIRDANEDWMDVEGFMASRGAALMGFHFLDLPCEERRAALESPRRWDNNRSSTYWYLEELRAWIDFDGE